MKTMRVNLRLEANLIASLERAAQEESLDRGALVRKLLRDALGHRAIGRALQRYQRGEISIGRAAEESGLTHWDLLQLARDRGAAYPLTPEEAEERLCRAAGRASNDARGTRRAARRQASH